MADGAEEARVVMDFGGGAKVYINWEDNDFPSSERLVGLMILFQIIGR